jgi:hypothetical protein
VQRGVGIVGNNATRVRAGMVWDAAPRSRWWRTEVVEHAYRCGGTRYMKMWDKIGSEGGHVVDFQGW